jgi:hypothetical protein
MKTPSNSRRDLAIRHLVDGFNSYNSPGEVLTLQTFGELTFGLTGTKDQNRVGPTNGRDYLIKVIVEMVRKASIPYVLVRGLLGSARKSNMLLHTGFYSFRFFSFVCKNDNNGLSMVDPQTDYLCHQSLRQLEPHLIALLLSAARIHVEQAQKLCRAHFGAAQGSGEIGRRYRKHGTVLKKRSAVA